MPDIELLKLGQNDVAMMKLPHPKRVELMGTIDACKEFAGKEWNTFAKLVQDGLTLTEIKLSLLNNPTWRLFFDTLLGTQRALNVRDELSVLDSLLSCLAHDVKGKPLYMIRQSLNERMMKTRIGSNMPVRFLKAPHQWCFLEFGENHQTGYSVYDPQHVAYPLEGAYVCEAPMIAKIGENLPERYGSLGIKDGEMGRAIFMCITGNPYGIGKDASDDSYTTINLYTQDEDEPVEVTLERTMEKNRRVLNDPEFILDAHRKNVFHLAKCLLYINSANARMEESNDLQKFQRKFQNLGSKKRAKQGRKAYKVYDKIIVGPTHYDQQIPSGNFPVGTGGTKDTHWREGFWKAQHYGPGNMYRKPLWIEPVLVNEHLLNGAPPPKIKTHIVK